MVVRSLGFLLVLGVYGHVKGAIDETRFHCVHHDPSTGNYLMRSNMPIATNASGVLVAGDFAYSEIQQYAKERASEECGVQDTDPLDAMFLLEVTLNNAFDDNQGLVAVRAWHSTVDNFEQGRLVEWPIGVAGIIPPAKVDKDKRAEVSEDMWAVDQLPQRVDMLKQMLSLTLDSGKPIVILVHCTAGCDRTGEMIGAYRLTSGNYTAQEMYALDVSECGRAPNYYSTHALEWYCIKLQTDGYTNLGDCLGFATCEPFGDCEPTNATTSTPVL